MSDLSLALAQTAYALRGFLRNARALIFTVIMPVFLLLLFNAIFHGTLRFEGHPAPASSYFTASIVSYQIMLAGFGSLLISVTTARQAGLLKRFRGTPMPGWVYLASEIGLSIAVVATTVTVLVAVGVIFDHVALSGHLLVGLVVYLVVGTASFCALGLALACRFCRGSSSPSRSCRRGCSIWATPSPWPIWPVACRRPSWSQAPPASAPSTSECWPRGEWADWWRPCAASAGSHWAPGPHRRRTRWSRRPGAWAKRSARRACSSSSSRGARSVPMAKPKRKSARAGLRARTGPCR